MIKTNKIMSELADCLPLDAVVEAAGAGGGGATANVGGLVNGAQLHRIPKAQDRQQLVKGIFALARPHDSQSGGVNELAPGADPQTEQLCSKTLFSIVQIEQFQISLEPIERELPHMAHIVASASFSKVQIGQDCICRFLSVVCLSTTHANDQIFSSFGGVDAFRNFGESSLV